MSPGSGEGPIRPPGSEGPAESPGMGGGFPSSAPAQQNPGMDMVLTEVRTIVTSARRLGMKFPAISNEVRQINNIVAQIAQKVQQSGPAPEPMAPPV